MTCYQDCHRHYGYLARETTIARKLLERHGRPCPETVKELRNETDMPMAECADMLRCMWRDMELEQLQAKNAKLWKVLEAVLQCAGEIKRDKGCDACPMYDENGEVLVRNSWCHLSYALRELGIEGDGQGQQVGGWRQANGDRI